MRKDPDTFDNLNASARAVAGLATRPRWVVYGALTAAAFFAWALLIEMGRQSATLSGPDSALPGQNWLEALPALPLPVEVGRFMAQCLTPAFGSIGGWSAFISISAMWMLMSVAMMLPSAAPLIRTYCEIADTAAAKRERAVHPLILVCGYLGVWLVASQLFAGLTLIVSRLGESALPFAPAPLAISGTALLAAGAYQFSPLKEACLKKCRRPFSILFARWTTSPAGVFRLGAEQGVWCLGCCWALMLVMFAVGVMNVFWMALIGLFTLLEKQSRGRLASHLAGAILLVWGAGLLLVSLQV